jgi:hypothetical protein
MGAGILPTTIHNGKLYFLFGKENKYADTPGWSDFGGGTDNNENYLQTAIREGGEELTGFLGSDKDLGKILRKGTYNIDTDGRYRMHIFYMNYEPLLPFYYNNNSEFLQKRLNPKVIEKSRIFEKSEIKWVCVDDILTMKYQFRSYFQKIVDTIYSQKREIFIFIKNIMNKDSYHDNVKQTKKEKTQKTFNKKKEKKKSRKNISI